MTFTPLVSPAVTPIDPSLRFPDSTSQREYFSPLTSPAIEAQNMYSRRRTRQHISAPTSGSIASPGNVSSQKPPSSSGSARTSGRKDNRRPSVSGRASGRTVRQSPLMKPQGRRKQASLNISNAGLAELAENSQDVVHPEEASPSYHGPYTNSDASGQSSISPEPLSEALMPPPTLPRSAGKSPNIVGKCQSPSTTNEPATPATLMRLPNQESSPQIRSQGSGRIQVLNNELMEDIMLPESAAAAGLPRLTIDTRKPNADDQITPTLSAKTPKLSANSTPRRSSTSVQVKSPTEVVHRRTESRSGHSSKARSGGANSHVSPAIRPKISPSIKPLVPHSSKS
jgi:hypothetical protein